MGEENDLKEQVHEAREKKVKEQGSRKSPDPTIFLVAFLALLILSISYFFVFALPKMKQTQLGLEKEKYEKEKQLQESYVKCVDDAEEEYESYIKLNGQPVKKQPGAYSAPEYIWRAADKNRNSAFDECSRQFRH